MPELPEVESFARTLGPELTGRTVQEARLLWRRTLAAPAPEAFAAQIRGREITGVGRRAKYLEIRLNGLHLFLHLRMSGDLYLRPLPCTPQTHDRLILELSDGRALVFHDPRKFGRAWLTDRPEEVTGRLGPEAVRPGFYAAGTARPAAGAPPSVEAAPARPVLPGRAGQHLHGRGLTSGGAASAADFGYNQCRRSRPAAPGHPRCAGDRHRAQRREH